MPRIASILTSPSSPRSAVMILGGSLLAAGAIVPLDAWIVTHVGPYQGGLASKLGGDVVRELEFLQQFGAVTSMVIAGCIVLLLDPAKKRGVLNLAITLATCGLLGHVLKIFFARPRPRVIFDSSALPGFDSSSFFAFFWRKYPLPRGDSHLFAHSWELWKGIGSDLASFPSSHAMTSACAATCLAHLYPRLSPLLLALALGVALCRVLLGAHYLSDVVFGSCAGYVVAAWMMQRLERLPSAHSTHN